MKFINLSRKKVSPEQPLELFDTPEKIMIRTFYQVLETGNLTLLSPQPERLNPENETQLTETWNNLLDFYYRETNRQAWENFLRNFRNVVKIQNEITSCKAAYQMCLLLDDRGWEHLRTFGIRTNDLNAVKSAILMKGAKLELAENKLRKKNEGEAFNFHRTLASLEYQLKRNIDTDKTSLAKWVAILADLGERVKAEQQVLNNQKRRR